MKDVRTNDAPQPAGHYSQAIVHDGIVYVSCQLPIDPKREDKHVGSIEEQTEQVLRNLDAILKKANSDRDHVLKVTVYVSDIALWARVNAVYARFFSHPRLARAVVTKGELNFGFQIEIEAIAAVLDH